jgi:adenosylcobinamide-phosphate synthase
MSLSQHGAELGLLLYAGGCAADALLRLPNALHPVAWFGTLAAAVVRRAPLEPPAGAGLVGLAIALGLPLAAVGLAHALLVLSAPVPLLHAFAQLALLYACASLFGLLDAARELSRTLREQGLKAARPKLGWLCSRDASQLDAQGLANGTIESLAENLSDSVVAPLCFLVCFGLEGAVAYRAINTLDAMIGYRGSYEWLGKASARLDDLANVVPARLTAALLWVAAAGLPGTRLGRGFEVWARDRGLTPSPNAGHPMSMAAGLLGLRLDKPGVYALGAELRPAEPDDIARAISLCRRAGLLALVTAAACVYAFGLDGAARN